MRARYFRYTHALQDAHNIQIYDDPACIRPLSKFIHIQTIDTGFNSSFRYHCLWVSLSVLLNTMLFLIGKRFKLRNGLEHRNLKFNKLTLESAQETEPERVVYMSLGERTT